jgi:hypothetical protein
MPHRYAHPYNTGFPERNAFPDRAAAADKAARAQADVAVENGSGGNVAVVFDCRVVFDQGPCIDDAVVAQPGAGIDDGASRWFRRR